MNAKQKQVTVRDTMAVLLASGISMYLTGAGITRKNFTMAAAMEVISKTSPTPRVYHVLENMADLVLGKLKAA